MSTLFNKIEIDNLDKDVSTNIYGGNAISSISYDEITYQKFFENFMQKNIPCIIKNVSADWECTTKWTLNNSINHEYISKEYCDVIAPVADCNSLSYNSQCKKDMRVDEYMFYLKNDTKEDLFYLKDWHLRHARPKDAFYEVPFVFASDWLNEYAQDKEDDDYMFVYIGPKDSWTPLHVDVYSSYSWSVNVVGRKKWILFLPGEENKLKDFLGNLPILFDSEVHKNIKYYEVFQERGDAIFVPSGWHHQVTNLIDTISVNHNWINGCNLQKVWIAIQECLKSVEHEIEQFQDTPEYSSQCQLMLKALFGMNYEAFILFMCHIAKKRLLQLSGENYLSFNKYSLGLNHINFDLAIILKVMNDINNNPDFFEKYLLKHLKCEFLNIKDSIENIVKYPSLLLDLSYLDCLVNKNNYNFDFVCAYTHPSAIKLSI